jgi:hypothetical protein
MTTERLRDGATTLLALGALLGVASGLWLGAAIGGSSDAVAPIVGIDLAVTLPPEPEVPYALFAPPTHTPPPTPRATPPGGTRPGPTATPFAWCPAPAGSVCTARPALPPTATAFPTWPGAGRETPGARYVMPIATPAGYSR